MRRTLALGILVTALTLSGCAGFWIDNSPRRGNGPPPHAPAHGYRRHHHGVELTFDTQLGVYVVMGRSNYFFIDGHYLRIRGDAWEVSTTLRGPWRPCPRTWLPAGLLKGHPAKAKARVRKRSHPAKGDW